jgi:hypothetical protein
VAGGCAAPSAKRAAPHGHQVIQLSSLQGQPQQSLQAHTSQANSRCDEEEGACGGEVSAPAAPCLGTVGLKHMSERPDGSNENAEPNQSQGVRDACTALPWKRKRQKQDEQATEHSNAPAVLQGALQGNRGLPEMPAEGGGSPAPELHSMEVAPAEHGLPEGMEVPGSGPLLACTAAALQPDTKLGCDEPSHPDTSARALIELDGQLCTASDAVHAQDVCPGSEGGPGQNMCTVESEADVEGRLQADSPFVPDKAVEPAADAAARAQDGQPSALQVLAGSHHEGTARNGLLKISQQLVKSPAAGPVLAEAASRPLDSTADRTKLDIPQTLAQTFVEPIIPATLAIQTGAAQPKDVAREPVGSTVAAAAVHTLHAVMLQAAEPGPSAGTAIQQRGIQVASAPAQASGNGTQRGPEDLVSRAHALVQPSTHSPRAPSDSDIQDCHSVTCQICTTTLDACP